MSGLEQKKLVNSFTKIAIDSSNEYHDFHLARVSFKKNLDKNENEIDPLRKNNPKTAYFYKILFHFERIYFYFKKITKVLKITRKAK